MSTDSKLVEALRACLDVVKRAGTAKLANGMYFDADCSATIAHALACQALAAHESEQEQEQAGEAVAVPNLDPDGDTSRAGFAAMDAELVARWMSPWQVWREAVRWSTGQRAIHGITKEPKT